MENIKHLIIDSYAAPMLNLLMYWFMQTPLQYLDKAYLIVIAGTIEVVFLIIALGVPADIVTLLFQTQFCPGETFKEKWQYRIDKRKTRKANFQKEWPNSFLCRYLNQLNWMMVFFVIIFTILLKSASFFCIGLPSLLLIVLHDNRIKKKFNYELFANRDLTLNFIAIYIAILLMIHYFINHSLK